MKSIFDPSLRYTASFDTDVKKTFARLQRAQRRELDKAVPAPAAGLGNVSPIARRSIGR